MTREEAIEIFKNMLDAWDNYYTIAQSDKKREAVWLAISSLETDEAYQLEYERTTKNDLGVDCISRAEAIKCLECDFDITGKENMKTVVNYINSAHDKIVNLPRVKQEPKTGRWIESDAVLVMGYSETDNFLRIPAKECSVCHKPHIRAYRMNYCPNCGAKMAEIEG